MRRTPGAGRSRAPSSAKAPECRILIAAIVTLAVRGACRGRRGFYYGYLETLVG